MPWTVIYGLFERSVANNSKEIGLSSQNSNLSEILVLVTCTCKFDKDPINNEHASLKTSLSHYSLWAKGM